MDRKIKSLLFSGLIILLSCNSPVLAYNSFSGWPQNKVSHINHYVLIASAGKVKQSNNSENDNLKKEKNAQLVKLHNQILQLEAAGQYTKAIKHAREYRQKTKKILGDMHPLSLLGQMLYIQGSYNEAEPIYKSALMIDKKNLEPNHPNIVRDLTNLSELYYALVQFDKGDRFAEEARKINRNK